MLAVMLRQVTELWCSARMLLPSMPWLLLPLPLTQCRIHGGVFGEYMHLDSGGCDVLEFVYGTGTPTSACSASLQLCNKGHQCLHVLSPARQKKPPRASRSIAHVTCTADTHFDLLLLHGRRSTATISVMPWQHSVRDQCFASALLLENASLFLSKRPLSISSSRCLVMSRVPSH